MTRPVLLQVFSPSAAPAAQPANGPGPDVERQLAEAWDAGHAAGVQDGTEAAAKVHAEAQDQLRAALVEAIRDQRHGQLESQARILSGIAPLVRTLVARLAPGLARAGLADHVAEEVERALRERPDPAPTIRCAEESLPGLQQALAALGADCAVTADARLTPLEAQVHWDDGFQTIDLGGAVARLDRALAATAAPILDAEEIRHAG
ncbi:hypothetical protein GE300_19570 [Rhodobacteraceae bacterium 2CG4]|uniref:Flagellar assembly protein FliH n=1 Tax=Halovulum marinum TaxID=2662447 RepID=A0A6L5Z617_9RHOB|nr:hypothetical protein [Halovulum marinum]MSU91779.1 hypothetical protein [Halovulum marinum]